MPHPARDRGPWILALAAASILASAFAAPAVRLAWREGGTAGIHIGHTETLSLTTYGRWWVWPPHRFMTDGFSGDLPTFYNFLSDTLLNLGAALTGLMPMTFQALLYAPALGFLFVWLAYVSLAAASGDRWTAAFAAAVAAFTVDPMLSALVLGREASHALDLLLHVPFQALGLGNGQSLGWVLFLPVTCLLFVARERFTPARAALHGTLLGLLFLAHTLTFINVACIEVVYLSARRALASPRDRLWAVWAGGTALVVAAFAFFACVRPPHTFATLALFFSLALALLFATDHDRRFYLWSYIPVGLVMLPYALRLVREWRHMAGHEGVPRAVAPAGILLFFVLHWALAAAAWRWGPRGPVRLWAGSMLAANLFLAGNQVWAWGNHPYRFAINLVFPLAILAALGLRHAPRLLAVPLGACLLAASVPQVVRTAENGTIYARAYARVQSRQRLGAFLAAVRRVTDTEPDRTARILNPPEFQYSKGTVQSAVILNASSLRGFVPDYRYVLWPERHRNRLTLFCFLFPSYPQAELHTRVRACDGTYEPRLFEVRDRRLRASILPVYGIRYAASINAPFNFHLPGAGAENGWALLATTPGRHFFFRIEPASLPGVARLSSGTYDASGFSVACDVLEEGSHRIVLGGRKLSERAPVLSVDGHEIAPLARDPSWIVADTRLSTGKHTLALPHANPRWEEESDFVYFLAVIHEHWANTYLTPAEGHDACSSSPRPTPRPPSATPSSWAAASGEPWPPTSCCAQGREW